MLGGAFMRALKGDVKCGIDPISMGTLNPR